MAFLEIFVFLLFNALDICFWNLKSTLIIFSSNFIWIWWLCLESYIVQKV